MKLVWEKFKKTIEKYSLVRAGDKILLAVSTGPDSMCMLHLFHRLKRTGADIRLYAAYIDHGLRPGEVKNEIRLLQDTGKKMGIPVRIRKINVSRAKKKAGTEAAARKLRYGALVELASDCGCGSIATGHNINDQAETVILNLLRSAGTEGVTGIPVSRELAPGVRVIRPLLKLERAEIMRYIRSCGIRFCTDSTNLSESFARNRVRASVMPLLVKLNPGILRHLDNAARWNLAKERYFDDEAEKVFRGIAQARGKKKIISLDLRRFLRYNIYIQFKVLSRLFFKYSNLKNFSNTIEGVIEAVNGGEGVFLSDNVKAWKDGGKLRLRFGR
jgi:tRNA(Ile)-lysidine synthase